MFAAPSARLVGWEIALAELVFARHSVPFTWGTNDCVTFAADAMAAVTGIDPIAPIRGTWHDRASADAALTAFCGFASAERAMEVVAEQLALPRVPATLARRGDVVAIDGMLAVVTGAGAAAPGRRGLVFDTPPADAAAWRI